MSSNIVMGSAWSRVNEDVDVRKNYPTNAGWLLGWGVTGKRIAVTRATFRQVIHNKFEHKFCHFFVASR
jgi:hypothetical protein